MRTIALTIAGSDSGGGAGIQADIKAMSACSVYAASVITAITAQNTKGVTAIHEVPPDIITAQLQAVFDDFKVGAVKIGMLGNTQTIEAVASFLSDYKSVPVILDPVMVAKGGDRLLQNDAIEALKERLLPLAFLVTPNLPEAAALLDEEQATSRATMLSQAKNLADISGEAGVLVKGGHLEWNISPDLLWYKDQETWLEDRRVDTLNTHGTGCTYSAAIAAGIANGLTLKQAVREAKTYLAEAIARADGLNVGQGRGPVHHFQRWWL